MRQARTAPAYGGIIRHYQDPENFGVALLDDNGAGTVTPR